MDMSNHFFFKRISLSEEKYDGDIQRVTNDFFNKNLIDVIIITIIYCEEGRNLPSSY